MNMQIGATLAQKGNPLPRRSELVSSNTFTRTLTARIVASIQGRSVSDVAARMWPTDRVVAELIERAASAPAMTSVAGWAAELAQRHVYDTLKALFPYSAATAVMQQGLVLAFDGAGQISAPGFTAEHLNKGFVAEGQPIPVHAGLLHIALLQPYKVTGIMVLTREMVESSNIEAMITQAASSILGRALDEIFVDANPADAARPAGLRNGVAITPASTATNPDQAFTEDMGNLAQAVSEVASNAPLAYIAGPGRRVRMMLRFANNLEPDVARVFASGAVINDVICIAPPALVSAFDPDPQIETAKAASLHMDDVPLPINAGTPAAPVKGMFQTDSIAVKMRWPVTWALRDTRGFAWTTPTAW